MTEPGSSERSNKSADALPPPDPGPGSRQAGALLAGLLVGGLAAAALLGLGLLLEVRLAGGPWLMLALAGLLFAAAALYAGWLAGMMAYSAIRGESGTGA